VAVTVAASVVSAGALSLSETAGAGSNSAKHHGTGAINGSAAVENSVRVSFRCDDSSGQWNFEVSDVQVIDADHVTPWATFAVTFTYGKSPAVQSHTEGLVQDLHNGLFNASASGSDGPSNPFCVTAASFKVGDSDTNGNNLFLIANLR
jgi:hypothetical protein